MSKNMKYRQPITLSFPMTVYGKLNSMHGRTHHTKSQLIRAGVVLLYQSAFMDDKIDIEFLNELVAEGDGEVTQI